VSELLVVHIEHRIYFVFKQIKLHSGKRLLTTKLKPQRQIIKHGSCQLNPISTRPVISPQNEAIHVGQRNNGLHILVPIIRSKNDPNLPKRWFESNTA